LIFSGLTRFNTDGELEPDIASTWTVSPDGKTYTFQLRHNVKWQDGVPFTAQDVLFTIEAIQNPDTRSPLEVTWQGVKVSAVGDYTVVFTLPKPYTPFIDNTTVGLLPAHLLGNTDPSSLRIAPFNQQPVGTGPFKLDSFDPTNGEIILKANDYYYFGRPYLDSVTLRLYNDYTAAFAAYNNREVQGVARLQPDQVASVNTGTMRLYTASVPDEVAVFFKTTAPLLKDKTVRLALAEATDRPAIIQNQFDGQAVPLTGPLLATDLDLGVLPHQPSLSVANAKALLNAAGWTVGQDGIRRNKAGQKLELHLVTQADSPYSGVATELAQQWRQVGVQLDINQVDETTLQQSYIRPRNYDALLYGINVGADPDVYAYWDSSQASDPGLNLSVYSSPVVDNALESGRTLPNSPERAAKYRSFVEAWVADTPAVMLYTPTYTYSVSTSVYGIHIRKLINPADRFTGIEKWAVRVRVQAANQD
jgi:peptide/nickel transport system substrate-binding protein